MINLTNTEQHSIGVSVVESNNIAAAVSPQFDFNAGTITWIIQNGQVVSTNFIYGMFTKPIVVTINVPGATWTASSGQSGSITPTQQTTFHNLLINLRNNMETFSVNNGIIAGTLTAWT